MSDQQTEDQKKSDKKGGGAAWMQGSANVGSGSLGSATAQGASGGMLATIKAAMGPKLILTALLGTGAGVGGLIGSQDYSVPRDPGEKVFMARDSATSAQDPIMESVDDGTVNALELARSANTGSYGQVQGDAGSAEGGEVADGEGAASAEGVETAEDAADAPGAIPGMDPNAMAAMAEGLAGEEDSSAGKEKLGKKFGKLSSSLGSRSGSGPKLAGGGGLSGGIGGAFNKKKLSNKRMGQMGSMKASRKAARTKTAARGQKGGSRKGAFNRVNRMSKAMGNARTGSATNAAAAHSQQWDASGDTGAGITGAGASGIGAGGGSEFSADEGGAAGNPLPGTNSTGGGDNGPAVKSVGKSKNATPYQGAMDMMIGLIMLANVLIMVMGILAAVKKTVVGALFAEGISDAIFGIIMLLMAAVAVGALMIGKQHGQMGQGALLATAATTTGVTAGIAMWNESMSIPQLAATMIIGSIISMSLAMGGLAKGDKVREDKVKQNNARQAAANQPMPTVQQHGGGAQQ